MAEKIIRGTILIKEGTPLPVSGQVEPHDVRAGNDLGENERRRARQPAIEKDLGAGGKGVDDQRPDRPRLRLGRAGLRSILRALEADVQPDRPA